MGVWEYGSKTAPTLPHPHTPIPSVPDLLASLVDKSLALFDVDGGPESIPEPRYRLLETVREYASPLLSEEESVRLRLSHAEYYLELARSLHRPFVSPEPACLARQEADTENLRKALGAWIEFGNGEQALEMARQMANFWQQRGYLSEGREWFDKALRTGDLAPTLLRAIGLHGAAIMAENQGDVGSARDHYQAALKIHQKLDRPDLVASIHNGLGNIARLSGKYEEARAEFGQALDGNRTLGLELCSADNLANLGVTAMDEGANEDALEYYRESLEIVSRHDSAYLEAGLRCYMAVTSLRSGEKERARSLLEESLAISLRVGNREFEALCLHRLGALSRMNGEAVVGMRLLRQALAMQYDMGHRDAAANTLDEIAFTLTGDSRCVDENFSAAATIAGAADALRGATGVVKPLAERAELEEWIQRARTALGEDRYCSAWAHGRSMSLSQAVGFAHDLVERSPAH
jgi:tetratricopeptide (TPR) repeat protein